MTKTTPIPISTFGLDLAWILRLLAQLPPVEIDIPIGSSTDVITLVIDLKVKD